MATLQATITSLGGTPVAKPNFDFTAGGTYADVFTNYQTFLALSNAFEDTGVRAYKGQAVGLMSSGAVLTAALDIHSVEARHASEIRRLRGLKGWISNAEPNGLPAAIYAGEDNQERKMDTMSHKMKDCVMMKDGKMMAMKAGKTMVMDHDMTMMNGTIVMKDGSVKMKDGNKNDVKRGGLCVYEWKNEEDENGKNAIGMQSVDGYKERPSE